MIGVKLIKQHVWLTFINFCLVACWQAEAAYPKNFNNLTGCLLSYMNDGDYRISFQDAEEQRGELKVEQLTYDSKSACIAGNPPTGSLILNYATSNDNMESISLELSLRRQPSSGYWDVSKAKLKIVPINKSHFPQDTIELKPASDIYAPLTKSYSCSSLVFQNSVPTKEGPNFKITLKRFQLQPFNDASPLYVFAPSRDCSTWLTMPQIMGFLLVLFIIFTALFGVYLLLELGNQQGDIKFSKQAGMLMNQAQLDATKAD